LSQGDWVCVVEMVVGDENSAQIGQPADGRAWGQPLESFAMFFGHSIGKIRINKNGPSFSLE